MTAGSFPPCHRQASSTYTRYAVVSLPSAGRKISPPWRDTFPPCLRQTSSTYTRYAVVGLPSAGRKISPPWRDTFPPCHRQTSSTYTRYAVVGLPSAGQKISPPWRDLFRPACVRPGTPPINVRRGRRPAVERSGTNALGVRRSVVGADEAARPPSPHLYTNNKERTICTRSFCASWARWS